MAALIDATVPRLGKAHGLWSPNTVRSSTVLPICAGSAWSCARSPSRSARTRSRSARRNAGWSTQSAKTSSTGASEAAGNETAAMSESLSDWLRNSAAWSSKAAAMALASRSAVPSSSMSATKLAVPGRPGGSVSSPARTTSSTVASGTAWSSTIHTASPLRSVCTVGTGARNTTGGPAAGSTWRKGASGVPVSDTPASVRAASAPDVPGGGVPELAQARASPRTARSERLGVFIARTPSCSPGRPPAPPGRRGRACGGRSPAPGPR